MLSVWMCVCLDVGHGGTNHNRCTQRLVILHTQTCQCIELPPAGHWVGSIVQIKQLDCELSAGCDTRHGCNRCWFLVGNNIHYRYAIWQFTSATACTRGGKRNLCVQTDNSRVPWTTKWGTPDANCPPAQVFQFCHNFHYTCLLYTSDAADE